MADHNNDLPVIAVRSEAEAYELLQAALEGHLGPWKELKFEGWPVLTVHLEGDKFDQTLTAPVMKSLLEYQSGIYHAFALSRYGNPSKRLTEAEKDALEIRVKVQPGSTGLEIDFQTLAVEFIKQIGGKVDPTHVFILLLSFLVLYFGTSAFRSYLENRKETRLKEIGDETQQRTLEVLKFTSAEETKRTEILARAMRQEPRVNDMAAIAYDAHTDLARAIGEADEGRVNDVSLQGKAAVTLVHNARRKSEEVRLDGRYSLRKLDWSDVTRARVRIYNVESGQEFDADLQDDTLTGQYKELLKQAEWNRSPVRLVINAHRLGNEIRGATILTVEADKKKQEREA